VNNRDLRPPDAMNTRDILSHPGMFVQNLNNPVTHPVHIAAMLFDIHGISTVQ
jgi:hypothetical protein